jgi:hypothetical protein
MRKWTGTFGSGSLPDEIRGLLEERSKRTLERFGLPDSVTRRVVDELVDEVSFSFVGREHVLKSDGAGRPLNGPANLLSVNIVDVLRKYGIRGNWLSRGDDEEDGPLGPVAELEAIAQTAFREACNKQGGVMARPARISKARKTLGKVHRN